LARSCVRARPPRHLSGSDRRRWPTCGRLTATIASARIARAQVVDMPPTLGPTESR
jgi:hypothetical protein